MTLSFSTTQSTRSPAPSHEAKIYTHPRDVASDPKLTITEKRVILASWMSDARAVEDAPSLRQLDSGAIVPLDQIHQALVSLDQPMPEGRGDVAYRFPFWDRRHGLFAKWLRRRPSADCSHDDDDEPPPAPAGLGKVFRPTFVTAHGVAWQPGLMVPGDAP